MINANMGFRLEGRFRLTAHSTRGERTSAVPFRNLIVNGGLDRIGSGGALLSECRVGSGGTAPAGTDTALVSNVATSTTVQVSEAYSYHAGPPDYIEMTKTFRFATGVAAGNLAEVGVGWPAGLFSRALIVDEFDVPTTFTVASDEVLDVQYILRVYPPAADVTGSITLDGTSYGYTIRPCRVSDQTVGYDNWGIGQIFGPSSVAGMRIGDNAYPYAAGATIGARTAAPSGSSSATLVTVTTVTYVPGEYKTRGTWKFELNKANLSGGLSAVIFGHGRYGSGYNGLAWQMVFDSPVPKDATKYLAITFDMSWANA